MVQSSSSYTKNDQGARNRFSEYVYSLLFLLLLNLVFGAGKLLLGYLGSSSALRSDGWNNSADFVYTLLLSVGLWLSSRSPDETYPVGYSRFESLISVLVALVILATGGYVLWDAYHAWFAPRLVEVGLVGIALLLSSCLFKGLISWFLHRESERLHSPVLNAISRDQAGDILADVTVLVAVFSTYVGWYLLDPIVAFLIGLFILHIGWETMQESIQQLAGRAPSQSIMEEVQTIMEKVPELSRPYEVRAHYVGPILHLSLNVKAPGELPLRKVHELEEVLRGKLLDLNEISRVYIHIEPYEEDSPI